MTRPAQSISLTRYLIEEQRDKGMIKPDLRLLIEVVARACKTIATQINKGALGGVLGSIRIRSRTAIRRANTCWCSIRSTAPRTST